MPDSIPEITAPDSTLIASDSVAAEEVIVNALEQKVCRETDAPRIINLRNVTLGRLPYTEGVEPLPRPSLPGYDSGFMTILVVLFLIIASNFRHYSIYVKTLSQNLFSVRERAKSSFSPVHTTSELRVMLSLVALVCVCEGVLLYSSLMLRGNALSPFAGVGLLTLMAAAYYGVQLVAYRTVGYLFTSSQGTSQWIKGFNASQTLLGLGLAIPALLALFNPGLSPLLLAISCVMYLSARIIFISKGFRIFYDNYTSIVYFILYLCTLEIIPPLLLYKLASELILTY